MLAVYDKSLNEKRSIAASSLTRHRIFGAPGMLIDPGSLKAEFRGCFPMDESAQSFRSGSTLKLHLHAIRANGQEIEINVEKKSDSEWIAPRQTP